MGAVDKNSIRQRILRLNLGEHAVFPVIKADYVASMAHRIAKRFNRKYTCPTTEKLIKVIRIQ
jgi:hypothetical protein